MLIAAVKLEGAGFAGPFFAFTNGCGTNVQGPHTSIDPTPVGRIEDVVPDPMQASQP
jgi:hypothetical protein